MADFGDVSKLSIDVAAEARPEVIISMPGSFFLDQKDDDATLLVSEESW